MIKISVRILSGLKEVDKLLLHPLGKRVFNRSDLRGKTGAGYKIKCLRGGLYVGEKAYCISCGIRVIISADTRLIEIGKPGDNSVGINGIQPLERLIYLLCRLAVVTEHRLDLRLKLKPLKIYHFIIKRLLVIDKIHGIGDHRITLKIHFSVGAYKLGNETVYRGIHSRLNTEFVAFKGNSNFTIL